MSDGIYKAQKMAEPQWAIVSPDNKLIANTLGGDDEENANLIANACNRYVEDYEPVRVGCTLLVHRHGRVLLGERGRDCQTASGLYAYPGGRMDFGETPKQSVVRELFEEAGLVVDEKDVKFLRYCNEYFPEQGKHYVSLVFVVECMEGDPISKEPNKCKEWEWIEVDHLPDNMFEPCRDSIMLAADEILGIE